MKIGLKEERWGDEQLVEKLLDMMQQTGADFTATFRQLSEVSERNCGLHRAFCLSCNLRCR